MGKTIFIVDDEEAICEGLTDILDRPGYKIFTFTNGMEALEKLDKENPDLCIVDYKMPEMDGIELIEKIKNVKSDIYILLLTGSAIEITDGRFSRLGINKVLEKPISRKDVISSVRDVLGEFEEDDKKGGLRETAPVEPEDDLSSISKEDENGWKKGRVLIVDDEEELRLNLKDALISNNYNVRTVRSGNEALEIINSEDFDIVLMDICMPGMNGIETVDRIKSMNPQTFIIMMTGEADDEDIKDSIQAGGYACIRKPFTIKKLLKSLEWYAKAGKDLKEEYELTEKLKNRPVLVKILADFRRYLTQRIELNKMKVVTLFLSVVFIILGILIILFVQSTGSSISDFTNRITRFEGFAEKVIGYLERDEQRELGR